MQKLGDALVKPLTTTISQTSLSRPAEPYTCDDCGLKVQPVEFDVLGRKHRVPGCCHCQEAKWRAHQDEVEREERERRLSRLFNNSKLGPRFWDATFAAWGPQPGTQAAFDESERFVDEWDDRRKDGHGLLIFGGAGNGKSHLAAAIIHALIRKGAIAIFQPVPDLLDRIKATYDDHSTEDESQLLLALEQSDLLVLDDLGAERCTQWTESRLLRIIDSRYRQRRPIVATTNVNLKELNQIVGFRSMDRLLEMCTLVENTGESYRRKMAQQRLKERGA